MVKIIGLKELRENTDRYISVVSKGDEILVVRRTKPIFKLVPPEAEERWETVIDFTGIKKGGVTIDKILTRL